MARGNDANSASCQFFICNADSEEALDGNYAAFGYVVEGLNVVDEITKNVWPVTLYADFYQNYGYNPQYQTYNHTVWQYLGNGAVNKDDQPVIKYIKVLDSYGK